MDDTIFKPLTHMDRDKDENLTSRFQRRDTTPRTDDAFQNIDTTPTNPERGWGENDKPESLNASETIDEKNNFEANGCFCPADLDGIDVYEETVIVEFYDDIDNNELK